MVNSIINASLFVYLLCFSICPATLDGFPYPVNGWIGLSQGNEYEPAPGKVYRNAHFHNGVCWTHGNFVARKKRSGWFSFLPAPRTLFFFELAHINDFDGVVTCTPLGMLYFFLLVSLLYNTPILYVLVGRRSLQLPHEYLCGYIVMLSV